MVRVVIKGQGAVVKEGRGHCGCPATGLVALLTEGLLIPDVGGLADTNGEIRAPSCDKPRAVYATLTA